MRKDLLIAVVIILAMATVAPAANLLTEGFDSPTFPPSGWTVYNFDGSTGRGTWWYRTTVAARVYNHSPGAADINKSQQGVPNNDWLISPRVGPIGPDDSLLFWYRTHDNSNPETLIVRISTSSDVSDTSAYVQIAHMVLRRTQPGRFARISLAPFAGQSIYIAWVYKISGRQGDGLSIDAITVSSPGNTVTFNQMGLPEGTEWYVVFNGVTYYSTGTTITIMNVPNGSYEWSVYTPIPGGEGVRYAASPAEGVMQVPIQTEQTIIYTPQYYLTVVSPYGTTAGEGWYDEGAEAYAEVDPLVVPGEEGVQYVFTGWSGDATGETSPSDPIFMYGPKTAIANWKTQYYLTVISNPLGITEPTGSGWYDAGAEAEISTLTPVLFEGKTYVFAGWTTENMSAIADPLALTTTVLVEAPMTVKANYREVSQSTAARTIGFWGNRNGLALLTLADAEFLNTLPPYETYTPYPREPENATPFSTTDLEVFKRQVDGYLQNANAKDMRYMLAAQLLATEFNVRKGFVGEADSVWLDDGDMIYEPGEAMAVAGIMDWAIAEWQNGTQESRAYVKDILDDINNNRVRYIGPVASGSGPAEAEGSRSTGEYALAVYPNPLGAFSVVRFSLPVSGRVTLKLYSVTGALVADLGSGIYGAGAHTVSLNAAGLARGTYFLKCRAEGLVRDTKLVVR